MNKQPEWDEKTKAYRLDFKGRASMASRKNFILVDENNSDVLLFGKCGNDEYSMDVTYPLSPLQAFQMAIAAFAFKLACQ